MRAERSLTSICTPSIVLVMKMEGHATSRLHLVLVPGFGGFDMLGRLEYYAGTTQILSDYLASRASPWGQRVVLHYFDNIPTASVRTRAKQLGNFLAKRRLRNEFQTGDRVALIGHSTGGLDVRQLLCDLAASDGEPVQVDGVEDETLSKNGDASPSASGLELLGMISHLVFISVPQRGTNIANWVRAQQLSRRLLISVLRSVVDAADLSPVEYGDGWFNKVAHGALARVRPGARLSGLLGAIQDTYCEAAQRSARNPDNAAQGRQALAALQAWLGSSNADFLAIDDLSCVEARPFLRKVVEVAATRLERAVRFGPSGPAASSLARSSDEERAREVELWQRHDIASRSYATVARPPFEGPFESLDGLRSLLAVALDGLSPRPESDLTYRLAYAACTCGPFQHAIRERVGTNFVDGEERRFEAWENDGVVNTASMLWPHGENTLVIDGDHADVIGHYLDGALQEGQGRKRNRYDILQSSSRSGDSLFDDATFRAIWYDVFDFCTGVGAVKTLERSHRGPGLELRA
jgi:triacylglycerol lipase